MPGGNSRHPLLLALELLLLVGASCAAPAAAATDQKGALRQLFNLLDKDHDGQLRKQELKQYIGGLEHHSSSATLDQAVEGAIGRLDSPDVGLGVSWKELEHHLHSLLQDVKVSDWVTHGLGLPQYAEAFRANSITALDLPMLVNDGGTLLQTELKVESPLHRQQLLRAMQRQILGLGSPPGPMQQLVCSASVHSSPRRHTPRATTAAQAAASGGADSQQQQFAASDAPASLLPSSSAAAAGSAAVESGGPAAAAAAAAAGVVCSWLPPVSAGQPVLHKYVLQRLDHSSAAATWQTVAELQDSLSVRYRDASVRPGGVYQYRLAAWNVYGRSPYALSHVVTLPTADAHPASAAAGQQPQQQQHPASSDLMLRRPSGLVVSPQQQQQQLPQQHVRSMQSSCSSAQGNDPTCANDLQHHFSPGQAFASPEACSSDPQSSSSSVVWLVGLNPDEQPWQHSTPATAAGRAAQQELAASMLAAGAGGAGLRTIGSSGAAMTAAPAAAGGSGGGSSATGSHSSSRKPAMTARLAALLGSAWHSSMDGWLKALLNSLTAFVLVVLPICVRLLPVQTLTRVAHALAWVLQLLPAPLRQRLLLRPAGPVPQQQQQQQQLLQQPTGAVQPSSFMSGAQRRPSSSGGCGSSRPSTPQKVVPSSESPGAVCVAGQAGGVAVGRASPLKGAPAAAGVAGAAGADPGAAAAAPVRPRLMPRSVSDFNLVRQYRSLSPLARPGTALGVQQPTTATSSSSSPGNGCPAGGLAVAGGGRCASEGGARLPAVGAGAAGAGWGVARDLQLGGLDSLQQVAGMPPSSTEGAASSRDLLEGAEATGAAAAVGSSECDEEAERELQQYLLYTGEASTLPTNKCCCFPGCQQQFGLRHWKATMQRHYCGRCQQAFCLQHTAYSPHGTSGTCGVQSRCLCIDCFYEYTPEYQAFLASRNTLVGKRSRSGPPAAAAAVAAAAAAAAAAWAAAGEAEGGSRRGSGSSAGGSKPGGVLGRLVPQGLSSGGSSSGKLLAASGSSSDAGANRATAPPEPAAPSLVQHGQQQQQQQQQAGLASEPDHLHQQQQQPLASQRSLGAGASSAVNPAACSKGLKSRMLWGRGLTKALGVVRFQHAGAHVHGGSHAGPAAPPAAAGGATRG